MTVKDVIESAEALRPGSVLSVEDHLVHLNRLESQIYDNIISLSEPSVRYTELLSEDDELVLPPMYSALYTHFLTAQIDMANGDILRYSNNMVLYNALLSSYTDWYIRNHMPRQRGKMRWR